MLPWQQMQREIASLQNTLSQQQQQSGSSKGEGTAANERGAGRGPGSHQCLRRGEERRGQGWVAVEGQGAQGREAGSEMEVSQLTFLLCSC